MTMDFSPADAMLPIGITEYEGPFPDEASVAKWQEWNINRVRKVVADHGTAPPGLLFLAPHPGEDGFVEGYLDLRPFHEDEDALRDMPEIVVTLLRQVEAFACFVVREAWTTEIDKAELSEVQSGEVTRDDFVKEHPDAVEVVTCLCESRTTSDMRMFRLQRADEGATLGDEIAPGEHLRGGVSTFLHQPVPGDTKH
jgi:hypothetical protein